MNEQALEKALKNRLGKLSATPVEMENVQRRVEHEILPLPNLRSAGERPMVSAEADPPRQAVVYRFPRRHWRMALGIAASIVVVVFVGMALFQSRPAEAAQMMQLHRDLVAGKIATLKVQSIAEVNAAFAAFGEHGLQVQAPEMHVMSCCLQKVGNKQVYCVLLNEGLAPVTLVIADSDAVEPLKEHARQYKGETFQETLSGDLTMVTLERQKHRICLIGSVSAQRLMELTEGLQF